MINVPLFYVDGSARIGSLSVDSNLATGTLKIGNTEITEAQLQQLLQLIQNQ